MKHSPLPHGFRGLVAFLLLLLASCTGVEEKRIRELLNEKGFGTRAQGIATVENYVSGGDAVVFFLDPGQVIQPGMEQLAALTQAQAVGIDGTIHVPYVGNVPALGLTEPELEDLVGEQLQALYSQPIRLTARIVNQGKAFYVFGEAIAKGRLPMVKGDLTVLEAVATVGVTSLANIGRVHVIRPDAQNPLVMEINFREMVLTGNTTYNVLLQDNDIIYIPPTFFGTLTRFIQKMLEPVSAIVNAMFGFASLQSTYDYLVGNTEFFYGYYRPYGF